MTENDRLVAVGPALKGFLLLGAALALGCSASARDPILDALSRIERATEARDANAVGAFLSPEFRSEDGLDREAALSVLRQSLAGYESVAIDILDPKIERDGSRARVRCEVHVAGTARRAFGLQNLLPPSAALVFDVEVQEQGESWRVVRGTWRELRGEPTAER